MATANGERDKLVMFQRAAIIEDPLGGEGVESWGDLEGAMAKVLFGRGSERRQTALEGASQAATFRVLSTSILRTVTERDRIVWGGLNWEITGSAPIAREIEFTAIVRKG